MPSFPINIPPSMARNPSPTKSIYPGSSPTSSLTMVGVGRRSPNHEGQMDAIAEDCTEDPITPTEMAPPTHAHHHLHHHHHHHQLGHGSALVEDASNLSLVPPSSSSPSSSSLTGSGQMGVGPGGEVYPPRPLTPGEEMRQRQTGANMVQPSPTLSPSLSQDMMAMGGGGGSRGEGEGCDSTTSNVSTTPTNTNTTAVPSPKNGLHHLLTSGNPQTKAPPPPTPSSHHHPHHYHLSSSEHQSQPQQHVGLKGMLLTPVTNAQPAPHQHHHHHHTSVQHSFINHEVIYNGSPMNGYSTSTAAAAAVAQADMAALLQIQQMTNHISTILDHFGIPFVHQNNVFTANHHGVQFQIHVARNIQLQYIAGDTNQYQSLSSQLYSRLLAATTQTQHLLWHKT